MPIAAILFDKDGTLIDFDGTWGPATYEVMRALAKGDEAALLRQAEALHFSLDTRRFLITSPLIAGSSASYGSLWGEALGRSDLDALKREIDALTAIESLKSLAPIGRPSEVLAALKARGLRLGLATNDSEASARRQAEALGLTRLLDFIAGYDSGHGGKPEPGMALAFARHVGVAPSAVAMVGDTLHDLRSARAAGALAVAVLTGPAAIADLADEADHVLDDIGGLLGLIDTLAAAEAAIEAAG
ncbi:MAG TPA: HAD family hydrolase [Roseiarcus sp.]|nr:HAD family hydrolase [Roseiarcus sp.]